MNPLFVSIFSSRIRAKRAGVLALFCAGVLLASLDLRAANVTWSSAGNVTAGGNGNWTGGNTWWNGTSGVAWTASDNATFSAAGNTTVNSDVTVGTLTINSSTANISILAGAGNLTVNTSITALNSANTIALTQTVGANITTVSNLDLTSRNGGTVGTTNLSIGGIISGSANVIKNGNGTLTLSGLNTYTGQNRLNDGTISISTIGNFTESSSLGRGTAGTSIRMGSTTTTASLTYTGSGSTSNRTFQFGNGNGTGSGTINNNGAGALVFTAANFNTADTASVSGFSNRTITLGGTNTGANEIQGVISNNTNGTVSITKSGAGTWKLSGNNTYTGGVTIAANGGTIIAGHNNALGTGAANINGSGQLRLVDGITLNNAITFTSQGNAKGIYLVSGNSTITGNITLNEETVVNNTINTNAGTLTISGNMSGLGFAKSGAGTLILTGNNTYTSTTTVSAGVLNIRHANALGTTAAGTTVTSGAALELQGGITVGAEALSLSETGLSATGALRNISGDNTYGGAITLAAHSTIGSDAGTLTLSGDITGTKDLTIVGAGNTSIVGNITTSASALTKNGTGTLFLSGTNSTYSGVTTINDGVVNVAYLTNNSVNGPLGAALDNASKLMLAGGTLQYTGNNATSTNRNFTLLGNFTIDASGSASNATMSFAGTSLTFSQTASATLTLTGSNTGSNVISGVITNNSSGNLTSIVKSGVGTWVLAGSNTYNGTTTINAGTLQIGPTGRLGAGSYAGNISNNATLIYSGTNAQTLSGIISGTGGLTHNASSTLTLTGNNSYSGVTTVNSGSLRLQNAAANSQTLVGNITVSGGILGVAVNNQISDTSTVTLTSGTFDISTVAETIGSVNMSGGTLRRSTATLALNSASSFTGGTVNFAHTSGRINTSGTTTLGNVTFDFSVSGNSTTGLYLGGDIAVNASTTANFTNSGGGLGRIDLNAANRTIDVGTGAAMNVGWTIAGTSVGITKNGSGTLVLTAANTYNGTTTINAGTLSISGGSAINNAGTVTLGNATGATFLVSASETIASLQGGGTLGGDTSIASGQTLTVAEANTNTYSGILSGAGIFAKSGAGNLTLSNDANTISGGVWVQQGTVYAAGIGNASASGYLGSCGTIQLGSSSNTGTLRLTGSTSETTDKVIDLAGTTGGATLTIDTGNTATYTFSNNFTASGVGAKTLALQGSGTSSGGFVLNGVIVDSASGATSLSVGGSGGVTVTLGCATNSFSGPVSINGNTDSKVYTLQVAGIGNTGEASYLGANSTINIGSSNTGTNILKYTGTGETTDKVINLANSSANHKMHLDASNASGLLKFTSDFTATGTAITKDLTLTGSGNAEIAGLIVNGGNTTNVTKNGTGTWTLSGNNSYTGTTTVSGGNLVITGTNSGSAITVNSGGKLAGTGTGGNTTINSGGTISPGNSPGILTVGGLTLNGNGTYTWEMADATGVAGTGWDQINATGLLTVGSNATSTFKIAITSSGAPANWDYTSTNQTWDIIDYGTISGFNASYFTLNTAAFGGDTSVDSTWSLVDTGSVLRLTYAYTLNTPTYTGASGDWSTGFTPSLDNTENAIFIGIGGTATNDIASGTLSSIGTLTFDGSNSYTLEAASGSAGYNSASALAIGGAVANNSTATQTINLSTSFAANQTINANTGGLVIGGNVSIGTGAILTVLGSNNTTMSGVVSGLGGLTKNSSSTLTLSGNNSYSGGTTITAGTLLVGHDKALGTGTIRFGGTIASTDGTDRTISNTVAGLSGTWTYIFGQSSGGTGNLTFTDAANATFASTGVKTFNVLNTTSFANAFISTGNVTVTKIGNGTLILAGNSTYSGSTIINAGTLQLGNGLSTGSLNATSSITNNGTLVFSRSNTMTQGTAFGTVISGTGNVIQDGSGTLVLNGVNTYSGTTTINTGSIQIGHANGLGSGGNITFSGGGLIYGTGITTDLSSRIKNSGSAILVDTNGESVTWGSALGSTNSGGLTKNGTGTLTLTGSNSYTGGTTLNTGTLVIGNTAAAGTGTITQSSGSSLLKFDTTGTVSNNMSIYNVASNQTMTLSGSITAQNTTYDVASGTTLSINGTISGSGGVTKNGTGTLSISGNNSYTGNTTINSGTLRAGATNALGDTSEVMVNSGGSLLIAASEAIDNAAAVKLNGGTIEFDGNVNETLGAFTLLANSTIDMADGHIWLQFSGLSAQMQYDLKIYNYTLYSDYLYFVNVTNVSESLSHIRFYSGTDESSFIGNSFIENSLSPYHVRPVPEPETYATAALLLLGLGIYAYRRRQVRTTT